MLLRVVVDESETEVDQGDARIDGEENREGEHTEDERNRHRALLPL